MPGDRSLQFCRLLLLRPCHGSASPIRALASQFFVSRCTHSQAYVPRSEASAQQVQAHKLSVTCVDGFRYVSSGEHPSVGTHDRDVIVCIGWMGCKEKHLDNVAQVWLSLSPSASVITYKPSPLDVLWPRKGLRTAEKIVASLPHGCRVVVHGFSTGGYLYSLMMQGFVRAMRSNRCRVSGCVFDCAVDMEGIADGMANALSKRQSIQAIVKSLTSMYLKTTHSLTTHFYIKASDSFKNPPAELKVPILVLAGGNDSIASVATQEKVVLAWRSQGIPSRIALFDGAKHCQLLVHSPQLYYSELRSFFSSLDSTPG